MGLGIDGWEVVCLARQERSQSRERVTEDDKHKNGSPKCPKTHAEGPRMA